MSNFISPLNFYFFDPVRSRPGVTRLLLLLSCERDLQSGCDIDMYTINSPGLVSFLRRPSQTFKTFSSSRIQTTINENHKDKEVTHQSSGAIFIQRKTSIITHLDTKGTPAVSSEQLLAPPQEKCFIPVKLHMLGSHDDKIILHLRPVFSLPACPTATHVYDEAGRYLHSREEPNLSTSSPHPVA